MFSIIHAYIYIYIYIYIKFRQIYIYVYNIYGIHFELIFFESESDLNPWPRALRAQALTTELSARTMRCAQWSTESSDREAQVIAR